MTRAPSSSSGPRRASLPDGPTVIEEQSGVRIGDTVHDWGAVVRAWFGGSAGEVVGRGYLRRSGATEEMPPFWEIGCVGVEVSVDESTGEIAGRAPGHRSATSAARSTRSSSRARTSARR